MWKGRDKWATVNANNEPSSQPIGTRRDVNKNTAKYEAARRIEIRREEVLMIRARFPSRIPIIVQRYHNEIILPPLDKTKFLVPQEITMSQFHTIIRNRIQMTPNEALFLFVNNRSIVSAGRTLAEIYSDYAGPDGFLYITYASQQVYGS